MRILDLFRGEPKSRPGWWRSRLRNKAGVNVIMASWKADRDRITCLSVNEGGEPVNFTVHYSSRGGLILYLYAFRLRFYTVREFTTNRRIWRLEKPPR